MSEKIPNRKQYRKADREPTELRRLVDSLDLRCIASAVSKEERWDNEILKLIERRYRNFLYLCGATGEVIVPIPGVDVFWHYHILDTLKYTEDCQRIFGFYLHHFPYLGKQGDEDELARHFARTKQLYEATFGEAYDLSEAANLDPDLAERLGGIGDKCG